MCSSFDRPPQRAAAPPALARPWWRHSPLRRTSLPLLVLCLLSACGDYSNDDIPFLEAVPTQLAMTLPVGQPDAGCQYPSDLASAAQNAGDSINDGIGRALSILDAVLDLPPTSRSSDSRTWGPFTDKNHPSFQVQLTLSQPNAGERIYEVEVQERAKGGMFVGILDGELDGADPTKGSGSLTLHFEMMHLLGIAEPGDPHAAMTAAWDFTGDPRTLGLSVGDAFGALPPFDYQWSGFEDGRADFTYEFTGKLDNVLQVPAQFTAQGAGSASVTYTTSSGTETVSECWDDSFCIGYLDDPTDVTQDCGTAASCDIGSQDRCLGE